MSDKIWCWACQKYVVVKRAKDCIPCPICGYKIPAEHQTPERGYICDADRKLMKNKKAVVVTIDSCWFCPEKFYIGNDLHCSILNRFVDEDVIPFDCPKPDSDGI